MKTAIRLKSGLTTAALLAAIQGKSTDSPSVNPDRAKDARPWRLAAAVLHVYDPASLRPFGATSMEHGSEVLMGESTQAIGWRIEYYRTLQPNVRAAALANLGDRTSMRRALAENPGREMTGVQILFESWLEGRLEPDKLTYSQLQDLSQLYEWGLEDFGGLPTRVLFDQFRTRRAGVALFEHLVDHSFVGRRGELQRLRDFVGVVDPSLWAKLRAFVDRGPRPPLVLFGKGGVGKTALIGRFLLEHVENDEIGWFPFVYLAFDSQTIDVRQPWTILAAASDQLAAQVIPAGAKSAPSYLRGAFAGFRDALARFRDQRATVIARASGAVSQSARSTRSRATDDGLAESFGDLLREIARFAGANQKARDIPVVLVLDTFEEVLYRTDEDLLGLWRMLEVVQERFPALRVLISGRGEPRPIRMGDRRSESFALDDLSESDARLMLERLGVDDPAARAAIVQQVGRSPLTLRLAARAAQQEEVQSRGFGGLRAAGFWGNRLASDIIQGQLYRRILDHIHDEGVRALAHPGMALRKVTPDIIENVLAPICMSERVDRKRAKNLFEALRREHSLVSLEDDSSLRYREEVRTPMLSLLARDKPDQLQALRERAVEYYASGPSDQPAERAEEIYNRMMLEQSPEVLDRRWMPGVERYLGSAVEEMPNIQKVWLARHMSIQLPEEVYAQADVAAWEDLIGGRALEMSRYGNPSDVLSLLSQRRDRTAESPLYAIEMRALMSVGSFEAALTIGRSAAQGWTMKNAGRLCEVLWLASQAAIQGNRPEDAKELLTELAELARDLKSNLPEVQALTELLKLEPEYGRADLRNRLAGALDRLTYVEIDSEPSLLRLACVRLGGNYPQTLGRIIKYVVGDIYSLIESGKLDLSDAIPEAQGVLREANPGFWESDRRDVPMAFVREVMGPADETLRSANVRAMLIIMSAEKVDLGAATLAGLDSYRESFELRASPESMA